MIVHSSQRCSYSMCGKEIGSWSFKNTTRSAAGNIVFICWCQSAAFISLTVWGVLAIEIIPDWSSDILWTHMHIILTNNKEIELLNKQQV